jgi:hypothetical protein
MKGADGKEIPPTNKKFKVEFCTVAHWRDGEIIEEKLFYDLVGLMKQIGLMLEEYSASGIICSSSLGTEDTYSNNSHLRKVLYFIS